MIVEHEKNGHQEEGEGAFTSEHAQASAAEPPVAVRWEAMRLLAEVKNKVEVANRLHVHRNTVGRWDQAFQKGQYKALILGRRGRRPGSGRTLDPRKEAEVLSKILGTNPDQLGCSAKWWTRRTIKELVWNLYRLKLSPAGVGKYLDRWELAPPKLPPKRTSAPEARTGDVLLHQRVGPVSNANPRLDRWCNRTLPKVLAMVKKGRLSLCWVTTRQEPPLYSKLSRRPCERAGETSRRSRRSLPLLVACTGRGQQLFKRFQLPFTAAVLQAFLQEIAASCPRGVVIIADEQMILDSAAGERRMKLSPIKGLEKLYWAPRFVDWGRPLPPLQSQGRWTSLKGKSW